MKRGILFLLWIFILLFSVATFYVSYSAYVEEREKYITENFAAFIASYPERELIPLPYPELSVIKVKKGSKIYASANFANPIDLNNYVSSVKYAAQKVGEVYTLKPSFDGFILFLFANPIFLAMNIFLFIIYLSFYFFMVKELEKPIERVIVQEKKEVGLEQVKFELIKYLKALKLLLHTEKVLGKDAIEKAKNLIDEMYKKIENK